ncbi:MULTISPECIES: RNA polymerase subunit sigma-70 [Bacillales]|uniref:RNA polymerase subunit sigma-70 n=1 Tax=Bacillales TaxID=1385 RepID=UPI0018840D07|nr:MULTISPECIES: RNA polymerase subunit sigma-70 [Bacillaceae]MBF0706419.1 RNA polymerase subunit sigma-70 [Pseudalkalibacillus hwajinpoensis]MDO6655971.1 RNA polymerase subunit sigma-70 [Anaerobacillus sp. 1_MG-2023]WLR60677.1 RNA polymerase subunit sigma-70 [Pseudalkalibacillus hwajinpoensis]
MRSTNKEMMSYHMSQPEFGIDFHDFLQKEQCLSNMELAEEFGLSLKSVKIMKQKMKR